MTHRPVSALQAAEAVQPRGLAHERVLQALRSTRAQKAWHSALLCAVLWPMQCNVPVLQAMSAAVNHISWAGQGSPAQLLLSCSETCSRCFQGAEEQLKCTWLESPETARIRGTGLHLTLGVGRIGDVVPAQRVRHKPRHLNWRPFREGFRVSHGCWRRGMAMQACAHIAQVGPAVRGHVLLVVGGIVLRCCCCDAAAQRGAQRGPAPTHAGLHDRAGT